MIKITQIKIHNFRGIKDLTFNLNCENFAVCGPNGTGKSGIVDSIEFVLTGSISRLTGGGAGNLSTKEHGPHVDCENLEDAHVSLKFVLIENNKKATITRNAKNIKNPTITPKDEDIIVALNHIESHPEFALSRREIIKYVLSKPGDRAKEVYSLLRLEKIETLRSHLNKIANSEKKANKTQQSNFDAAKTNLISAIGCSEFSEELILQEINKRRKILSLEELEKLDHKTSFKEGLLIQNSNTMTVLPSKNEALENIKLLDSVDKL